MLQDSGGGGEGLMGRAAAGQTFAGILREFQSLFFGEDDLGEPLLYKRTSEIIKRLLKCRRKLGG